MTTESCSEPGNLTNPLEALATTSWAEELRLQNAQARDRVKEDPQGAYREAGSLLAQAEKLGDLASQASALHTQLLSLLELGDTEHAQSLAALAA